MHGGWCDPSRYVREGDIALGLWDPAVERFAT